MPKEKIELVMHPEISKWRKDKTVNQALYEDLREKGQLQNLVARRLKNGKVELLAGYQRFLALRALGVKPEDMDIKVQENVSDKDALLIAMSENVKRKSMSPVEEGRAFRSMKKLKMPIEEIALRRGVSESYVRVRLDLLELPRKIQDLMENGEIPMSYAKPIIRLEKVGERAQLELAEEIKKGQGSYYGGVRSVEEANDVVEKTLAQVKQMKELAAKYGPCPQCGSTQIGQDWEKNKVKCHRCKYAWHKETKDPWEYYELKQRAKELGLEVEIGEGKAKITATDVAEVMGRIREEREKAKEKPPKTFRSNHTISELLAPFIKPENLNLFRVDGEKIEIRLIQDSRLHMTVRRHNYKTGEKSQIRPRGAWDEDRETCRRRVQKFLDSLEVE